MENGPPLSGTFPSGRMRLVVFLLTLYGLTCVSSNKLIVHKKLTAVLGKDIILPCKIEMTDTNFTQSSWQQNFAKNVTVIVVFNPDYGTDYDSKYKNRASLINPSKEDASIILRGVQLSDAGLYTCKMASFPSGMTENSTQLEVIVEPTILLAMGNSPLVNGSRETLVATCIAEHAIPAAEVFWETKVDGRTEKQHQTYLNGTITTRASYYWQPQSIDHEQKLTCVVRHPTLKFDFRSESVLLILYAPVITIYPRDKYWYVGQENVQLTCGARANPPPNLTTWTRLDGVMPKGLEVSNESLVFTRPLRRNDSGIYRCEVTNEIGVRSQDIDLLIQDPPPTTAAPSTTTCLCSDMTETSTTADRQTALLSPPTHHTSTDGSLSIIICGVVGGILILSLLLILGGVYFMRRRRTFRGDYYTKQYLGPSDMQRESQLDVLQPHELQEVYGDKTSKGSQDLKPKLGGDIIYPDYTPEHKDRDDWADSVDAHTFLKEGNYYPDPYNIQNMHPSEPPLQSPIVNNGSPHLPGDSIENGGDNDYVSHLDGSVISRREWYV
ncbi:nectin-3-like protein isoform X1 [Antennarius striatus]|uniref:nectin-3-like protein isoform X1 n=1 Tax=Antennarius striatus TaxID=241820 RepID=UPI0035AED653